MRILIHRIKKKLPSIAYSLKNVYRKIVTAKPSILIIAVISAISFIFLLGGVVYDLLGQAVPYIVYQQKIFIFYPLVQEQGVLESIFVITAYTLGVIGFLLAYQSTKYAYKPRQAYILLLMGSTLIIIAYLYLEYAIFSKMFSGIGA